MNEMSPPPPTPPYLTVPDRTCWWRACTHRPKLVLSRSWDGVVREEPADHVQNNKNSNHDGNNANANTNTYTNNTYTSGGDDGSWSNSDSNAYNYQHNDNDNVSGSVSESSGSIVNQRMFERSAPAAPGCGLDRAWIARQSHQDLLFGKEDEAGRGGYGPGGRRGARRRGHKEADQMKLLDNIARGQYDVCEDFVGDVGADFIAQVGGGWGGGGGRG